MILRVVRPGILATVQDLGRPGMGRWGVSPGGALDRLALRVANRLLGNPGGAPALELTGAGFGARFDAPTDVALCGADLGAEIDGRPAAPWLADRVPAGGTLALGARRRGARAYLAVPGGFAVAAVLGSASTDLDAALGGLGGRALRAGDEVAFPGGEAARRPTADASALSRFYQGGALLRYVPAPGAPGLDGLDFRVGPRSNRTGYRLEGARLPPAPADEISEAIAPGAIQIPPDGAPILLLADRQTVGGYACAGHVARADLPRAAQLWPGDAVRFRAITVADAQRAAQEQEAAVASVE